MELIFSPEGKYDLECTDNKLLGEGPGKFQVFLCHLGKSVAVLGMRFKSSLYRMLSQLGSLAVADKNDAGCRCLNIIVFSASVGLGSIVTSVTRKLGGKRGVLKFNP